MYVLLCVVGPLCKEINIVMACRHVFMLDLIGGMISGLIMRGHVPIMCRPYWMLIGTSSFVTQSDVDAIVL